MKIDNRSDAVSDERQRSEEPHTKIDPIIIIIILLQIFVGKLYMIFYDAKNRYLSIFSSILLLN